MQQEHHAGTYDAVCALIRDIPGASDATVGALENILDEVGSDASSSDPQNLQDAMRRIREREGYGRFTSHCLMAVGFVDPEHRLTGDGLSALRALARTRH
jgi:hypothetical protein